MRHRSKLRSPWSARETVYKISYRLPTRPTPHPMTDPMTELTLTRFHRTRLMQIWRSAGWPSKDGLEIDLLAAGLVAMQTSPEGHECLRLTEAGIQTLAQARQRSLRALSAHDRLAQRFAEHLMATGRIVWRELSLRAAIDPPSQPPDPEQVLSQAPPDTEPAPTAPASALPSLWPDEAPPAPAPVPHVWRMARPDLFSVRNTSVEAYLQPMVHEIKFSRADLLSDLRHSAKRQAYQWLSEACYYVFPAGVARPNEIPEHLGIWVLHGNLADGQFEMLRAARHTRCTLPFPVWLALSKATPLRREGDELQTRLGEDPSQSQELV